MLMHPYSVHLSAEKKAHCATDTYMCVLDSSKGSLRGCFMTMKACTCLDENGAECSLPKHLDGL